MSCAYNRFVHIQLRQVWQKQIGRTQQLSCQLPTTQRRAHDTSKPRLNTLAFNTHYLPYTGIYPILIVTIEGFSSKNYFYFYGATIHNFLHVRFSNLYIVLHSRLAHLANRLSVSIIQLILLMDWSGNPADMIHSFTIPYSQSIACQIDDHAMNLKCYDLPQSEAKLSGHCVFGCKDHRLNFASTQFPSHSQTHVYLT